MFPVEIWGTVAAWASALGTSGGVMAAAGYYIYDKRVEVKSQARHVTFVHRHWTKDEYHAQVFNFSDESIFDVTPNQGRKFRFRDVVADAYRNNNQLTKDDIETLREQWNNTRGGTMYVQSLESGHVQPGGMKEVIFKGTRSPMENYWIEFRDSMARTWSLELDHREPERIEHDRKREYRRRDIFLHRKRYLRYRERQKQLNRWLDENLKD